MNSSGVSPAALRALTSPPARIAAATPAASSFCTACHSGGSVESTCWKDAANL
jgi:hypothetical protein